MEHRSSSARTVFTAMNNSWCEPADQRLDRANRTCLVLWTVPDPMTKHHIVRTRNVKAMVGSRVHYQTDPGMLLHHLAAETGTLPCVGITDEDQNRSLNLVRADTVRIEGDASHKRLCSLTGSECCRWRTKGRQDCQAPM